jgi:predicted 2-oxoglutarate/Fe(II)-dependent dioxygenase YbiX
MDSTREQSLQIMPYVEKVMRQYNQYINETNSFPGYDANTAVSSCTPIRFNRCKTHTLVETHHDHIQELFGPGNTSIPSVSVVGLLNEEFTGGEFVLFKDTVILLKKGDILLFPSTFLYPHRVDKVKSGVRNSFVTWAF